jgi:hypothetical protein
VRVAAVCVGTDDCPAVSRARSKLAIAAALLLMTATPATAATGDVVWEARAGPRRSSAEGHLIALSPNDATVFEIGVVYPSSSLSDVVVKARATVDGTLLWSTRYREPLENQDPPVAVTVSPSGDRLYIAAVTRPFFDSFHPSSFLVLAVDTSDGTLLWEATYDDTRPNQFANQANVVRDIGVAPTGESVYLTGFHALGRSTHFVTIAYDAATGKQTWLRRYGRADGDRDQPVALDVGSDGTVFVSGKSADPRPADIVVFAYDGLDGSTEWSARFDGAVHGADAAGAMTLSADRSHLVIVGSTAVGTTVTNSTDVVALDLDPATGTPRWTVSIDEIGQREAARFVEIANGRVYVGAVGRTAADSSSRAFALTSLGLDDGARVWGVEPQSIFDLVVNPVSGEAYVIGALLVADLDWSVAGYDAANGSERWTASLANVGDDLARGGEIARDGGTLYVIGRTARHARPGFEPLTDVTTVAFDAS